MSTTVFPVRGRELVSLISGRGEHVAPLPQYPGMTVQQY